MSAASRKAVTDKIVTHADGEIERLRVRVEVLENALRQIAQRGPVTGYRSADAVLLRLVATQSIARTALAGAL